MQVAGEEERAFYLFALHTVSYLVTNQSGRYFHAVRASQISFVIGQYASTLWPPHPHKILVKTLGIDNFDPLNPKKTESV